MSYTDQDFETAASHTPGPWVAIEPNSRESYGDDYYVYVGQKLVRVCPSIDTANAVAASYR